MINMNIALMFGLFSPASIEEILNNSIGVIQNAADALQKCFVEGIAENFGNVHIINLPYVSSYPHYYRKFKLKSKVFTYTTKCKKEVYGEDIGFCNITGIKNYYRYAGAKKALKKWCKEDNLNRIVIVYALHTPFLKACVDVKESFCSDLKIVQIVPDLPEFMGQSEYTGVKKYLHNLNNKVLNNLYRRIDGFVLLSKYMTEYLPIADKPWTIIEGIFNKQVSCSSSIKKNRYILYTGTLAKRYGVLNLVEAFHKTDVKDYKLVICGAGDADAEILKYASLDSRILYKGQISREKALQLQSEASLLINPRTPEGEFTKYSFPSKTIEYMASGTPCMMYRLPGIPDEYFDYCITIDQVGIDYLKEKLDEVMKLSENQLRDIGLRAQKFIYEFKIPKIQTLKLVTLIDSIVNIK